jgi:hypothetical protein
MNDATATVIAAFVVFVPTMAAVFVSSRQYALERQRLRVDLFDKRFACYEAVLDQIRSAIRVRGWPEETDQEFLRQFEAARFLFSLAVSEYMQSIRHKLIEFSAQAEAVVDLPMQDPERANYLKLRSNGLKMLREEYPKVAEFFVPYMAIDPSKRWNVC